MLNLRPIDNKFYLSGGWTDVPKNAKWLDFNHFRAVLDLQFTPDDYTLKSMSFIRDTLNELNINYSAVPMGDGENPNLNELFNIASNILEDWDVRFTEKRHKILVKCGVGVSRSVAVLIDYYCKRDRLTYTEAKIRIANVDRYNYGGMPISINPIFEIYLRTKYPDLTSFGEKI
jgi:protein-tyrosine phosphatase